MFKLLENSSNIFVFPKLKRKCNYFKVVGRQPEGFSLGGRLTTKEDKGRLKNKGLSRQTTFTSPVAKLQRPVTLEYIEFI